MTSIYGFDSKKRVQEPNSERVAIELRNVYKAFGKRRILQGLSLSIRDGETFVIIGRSGTGKSVTFKHMVGLLRPDKGRVFLHGADITDYSPAKLIEVRKRFGLLFQDGALLKWMTVAENVALPLREHTNLSENEIRDRVMQKLELVEMAHRPDAGSAFRRSAQASRVGAGHCHGTGGCSLR